VQSPPLPWELAGSEGRGGRGDEDGVLGRRAQQLRKQHLENFGDSGLGSGTVRESLESTGSGDFGRPFPSLGADGDSHGDKVSDVNEEEEDEEDEEDDDKASADHARLGTELPKGVMMATQNDRINSAMAGGLLNAMNRGASKAYPSSSSGVSQLDALIRHARSL